MASIDDDKPTTSQIEKLNGGNYRSWATTMRAILREKKLFDIVDGNYNSHACSPCRGLTCGRRYKVTCRQGCMGTQGHEGLYDPTFINQRKSYYVRRGRG